jgi:aspartyl protease family protein
MRDDRNEERGKSFWRRPPHGHAMRWALVWLAICSGAALYAPELLKIADGVAAGGREMMASNATKSGSRAVANSSSFAADRYGHYIVDATVNGTSIRFLVDTGSTYVALTMEDARTIGLSENTLNFNQRVATANGEARVAPVTLREIRLGQLSEENISAVVLEGGPPISLLGMSFLQRLDSYDIRDGKLSLYW